MLRVQGFVLRIFLQPRHRHLPQAVRRAGASNFEGEVAESSGLCKL